MMGIFNKAKKVSVDQIASSPEKWPDYVSSLDGRTFYDFIKRYPVVMVDFWAEWCAPCRAVLPRMRRLSKIYKKKVVFGRINIEESKDIAKKLKISSIPTIIIFKDGKRVSTLMGSQSTGKMKNEINKFL